MLYFTRELLEERRFMVEVRVSTSSGRIYISFNQAMFAFEEEQDIKIFVPVTCREVAYSTQQVSFCMACPFGMVKTVRIWSLYVIIVCVRFPYTW
jgi:hypothetical protein